MAGCEKEMVGDLVQMGRFATGKWLVV